MNDAQTDHLIQMLGPINDQAAKNKLETDFEAASRQLQAFIEQQRIKPEDIPGRKIRMVLTGYNCMTLVTYGGHYVHVSASPGYGDSVDFCTTDCPDIEDAHNMGILSQEQYDEYKKAQQDYLGQRRKIDARNRIKRLVLDVGANNVQGYLDKLKQ
jgi:hypothetical protein